MYHLSMELSNYYSAKDHFIVEDLLDFSSNDAPWLDAAEDNGAFDDAVNGSSTDSSTVTAGNGYGSSVSSHGQHFSADFSQPCEEVAELEWLSNFVEDCFSNKDYHHKPIQFSNMNLNSSSSDQITTQQSPQLTNSNANASTVPAKTRSKRSRHNPSNWASWLPILSQTPTPTSSSSSDSGEKPQSIPMIGNSEDRVRSCLHCGSDKTPQWRMGPMGPKTLCNACGVRYKSGRLVPEYRPAASPTFVVSEHSNSHRKVVELRRQKEEQQQQMLFWS